jgi:hypothetical protein
LVNRRADAERRILRHARAGYALALADPAYHDTVCRRLAPSLNVEPTDMWQAIDWTWAVALGAVPSKPAIRGTIGGAVEAGAAILRDLLAGDDDAARRWADATGDRLSLGSTLQSHPFPDQASWFLRVERRVSASARASNTVDGSESGFDG